LSHAHVQMARELGMNPKKLGKLNNHDQEPWKLPLREFIGKLYFKRFGKEWPDAVSSIEEMAAAKKAKKQAKKAARHSARGMGDQRDDSTRSEKVVGFGALASVAPEAREAGRGAEFE
jgi:hypothetical protein